MPPPERVLLPRSERLARARERPPPVLIVGGGITGAGIALDLAARGVPALLAERGDFGGATSSASSRLIHGGLRYLQQGDLALVRDSCRERALLLENAAGLVWPEQFLFPLFRGASPGRAKLAAGLALYTLLSTPRALGWPRLCSVAEARARVPRLGVERLSGAGHYLDAATHDARLVLAVLRTAMAAGATCVSRLEVRAVEPGQAGAEARLLDRVSGAEFSLSFRAVVLAGGPFTDGLRARCGLRGTWIAPTRGAHLAVPRERLPTDGAVIFASPVDRRVMFLIPWPRLTIVGTTDLDAEAEGEVRATGAEVRYLLDSANGLCPQAALGPDDVVATWAGLRPLLAAAGRSPSERSREERVERDGAVYTIAGGKLTGYRSMAEKLGARVASELGLGSAARRSPTRALRLIGALERPVARPGWSALGPDGALPAPEQGALWLQRYGSRADAVAEACRAVPGGQERLGEDVLAGEVHWAVAEEDCLVPADFLLRRTSLGYAPRAAAEHAANVVTERMGVLLGWSGAERAAAEVEARAALERLHAWRRDR